MRWTIAAVVLGFSSIAMAADRKVELLIAVPLDLEAAFDRLYKTDEDAHHGLDDIGSSLSAADSLPVSGLGSGAGVVGSVILGSGAVCEDSGLVFFSRGFAVSAGFVVSGCWAIRLAHNTQASRNEHCNKRMVSPEQNDLNRITKAGTEL